MATPAGGDVRCEGCRTRVDVEDAVKIVVHRNDRQHWTVLCEDCAVVRCPDCDRSIDVGGVLSGRGMLWTSRRLYGCDRCDERVPGEDVVVIRRDNNPSYRKQVCADCLKAVPIPPGFRVVRDVFES